MKEAIKKKTTSIYEVFLHHYFNLLKNNKELVIKFHLSCNKKKVILLPACFNDKQLLQKCKIYRKIQVIKNIKTIRKP